MPGCFWAAVGQTRQSIPGRRLPLESSGNKEFASPIRSLGAAIQPCSVLQGSAFAATNKSM
jgi:hypothetical protein